MEGKVGQLWRLNVIDMASGVCLFEKIWTWPEVSIDKKLDLCKLVKSFFLLSGDFGEDKVSFARFLIPGSSGSNTPSSVSRNTMKTIPTEKFLHTTLSSTGSFIICLFHTFNQADPMIRSAVDRLRDEFHEFEELIGSCRDQLEEIVDEGTPEDKRRKLSKKVEKKFKLFQETVDKTFSQGSKIEIEDD